MSGKPPKREKDQITLASKSDEQLFMLFMDSVRDYAIFQLDPKGNVKTWNAAA